MTVIIKHGYSFGTLNGINTSKSILISIINERNGLFDSVLANDSETVYKW